MRKTMTFVAIMLLAVAANATNLWEETFDRKGTYIEKVEGQYWPYANQWFTGYTGGSGEVTGSLYSFDYTNVTSQGVSIRGKKLNYSSQNTIGLYFPSNKTEDKAFVQFEGALAASTGNRYLIFEICSPESSGGDLSTMVVKVNGNAATVPATNLGAQYTTSTVCVELPNEAISSIYFAFNNVPSQKFITHPRIVDCFITYTASSQLSGYNGSLDVGATTFGSAITSHTFANGTGTITCSGAIITIGDYAFRGCSGLTSITIPNSVSTIGLDAFKNCSGLTSVTIPNSVTTIGDEAFYDCSGLTSLEIPNSVTTIGNGAFMDCSGLTSVTIPNSVTTIGDWAFAECTGLTSVTIPNSVSTIESYTFYNCSGLTWVGIPKSLRKIEEYAFYNCSGLTSVTIPNSVITIGKYAFYGCHGLTSVTIPYSVNTIGNYAFYKVNNVEYNEYWGNATGSPWGAKCFNGYVDGSLVYSNVYKTTLCGCSTAATGKITIPNSVTTIGDDAFEYCSSLTSVTIPNSVTTIGNNAFYEVNNIVYSGTATGSPWGARYVNGYAEGYLVYSDANKTTLCICSPAAKGTIMIPNSVITIESNAFQGCIGLTSIEIPNSVTTIGSNAFRSCHGLTSVTIPNSVTTIGNGTFEYCSSLASVTIPNSVTSIGSYAFEDCSGLTSVTIPNSVTTIGSYAFSGCSGLTSVTIPNSVTTIGSGAFALCDGLTSVTIPNSVTTIGSYAFSGCSGLTSVKSCATTPPTCGSDCFLNVSKSIPIDVPTQSVDAYKQADGWKEFMNIQTIKQGQCGEDLYWQYNDALLVISGTGAMYDYTQGTTPWIFFQDSINNLVINNGCISIGNNAFANCTVLTSVTIPNSVTTIGENAFYNCRYLSDIYCYASVPPIATSSSFANYNVYLYVPCDNLRAYQTDIVFGSFKYIECIGAEEKPITGDEVIVLPSTDNATFTWPVTPSADGYSLEITKDDIVFCTLKFNAQGQLTGIAFAPGRGGQARGMASAEMTAAEMPANGWQFTVTGLSQGSQYNYTIDVLDASQQSIKQYTGEFTTTGGISTDWNQLTDSPIHQFTKYVKNGRLLIERNGIRYDAHGARVE